MTDSRQIAVDVTDSAGNNIGTATVSMDAFSQEYRTHTQALVEAAATESFRQLQESLIDANKGIQELIGKAPYAKVARLRAELDRLLSQSGELRYIQQVNGLWTVQV